MWKRNTFKVELLCAIIERWELNGVSYNEGALRKSPGDTELEHDVNCREGEVGGLEDKMLKLNELLCLQVVTDSGRSQRGHGSICISKVVV